MKTKIRNLTLLCCSILWLNNCSYFNAKVESIVEIDKKITSPIQSVKLYTNQLCSTDSNLELISEDESTDKFYTQYLNTFFKNKKMTFTQKAVFLSILEMLRRPDRVSPYTRLQIYYKHKDAEHFYDFRPKEFENRNTASYLKGLDYLLKKEGIYKGISDFFKNNETLILPSITVSKEFENFLKENKIEILKNNILVEYFTKGDDVITTHETFKYQKINPLLKNLTSLNFLDDSLYFNPEIKLVPSTMANNIKCNVDLERDFDPNQMINIPNNNSHYFALRVEQSVFIAAINSYLIRPLENIESTFLLKSHPYPTPLPVCQIKSANKNIVFFSTKDRSPSQHLKHLFSYEIQKAETFADVTEILNFSRHLFLPNPDRILYESKRGRKAQLDFFLSKNFPIYHVDSLGNIFGYASFNNQNQVFNSLIVDTRSSNLLKCAP